MKILSKYRGDFPWLRLPAIPLNENPFAAGPASGLRPEYSNNVRGYQRNCRGCYWQNPIISSTCALPEERHGNGRYTF